MKKYRTFIFLLFITLSLKAQYGHGGPKVIEKFKHSELNVVLLPGAEVYNTLISKYVSRNWKYGKFKFIYLKELDSTPENDTTFFLMPKLYRQPAYYDASAPGPANSSPEIFYTGISIVLSNGKIKYHNRYTEPLSSPAIPRGSLIAYTPIGDNKRYYAAGNVNGAYDGEIQKLKSLSAVKLNMFFKILFSTVNAFEQGKLEIRPTFNFPKGLKYYNRIKLSTFENKKILIVKTSLPNKYSNEIIELIHNEESYKNRYIIISEEELNNYSSSLSKYLLLDTRYFETVQCYFFLYDFESSKVIHLERQNNGPTSRYTTKQMFMEILNKINSLMNK